MAITRQLSPRDEAPLEAHELWLSALSAQGRAKATITLYEYALRSLIEWRGGHGSSAASVVGTSGPVSSAASNGTTDLLTVSRFEALRYTQHLTESHKPATVKAHVKSLRVFFGWCVEEEFVTANPFSRIPISIPQTIQTTATEEQIEAMLTSARRDRRDLALLTLLVDSGARRAEIAAIEMADVDLRAGTVTLRTSKTRARTIPISDRTIVAIGKWLRYRGVGKGNIWTTGNAYSLVRNAIDRHAAEGLTPHSMRRAFAIRWMLAGGSESSLMRHCGWSSAEMVRVYSAASADVIAAAEYKRLMG